MTPINTIKILLVEDDIDLGNVLQQYLRMNQFEVDLCRDGNAGFQSFQNQSFHLCILDVMLPQLDGFTLGSKIKEQNPDVPLIFLTAKNMKADKLRGLSLGADDYLTKPFDPEELLLRIKNILKRTGYTREKVYKLGEYRFYYNKYQLVHQNDEQTLTAREAELLKLLIEEKNKVIKRKDILIAVWGEDDFFLGRSMDVFITRLRKYLSKDKGIKIQTVRGVGVMLEDYN